MTKHSRNLVLILIFVTILLSICGCADAALPAIKHAGEYSVVLTYGQTPYQLGYRTNTSTGWNWWDGSGGNRQKNLILVNVFRRTLENGKPAPKPVSGLSISVDVTYPRDDLSTNRTTILLQEDPEHHCYCGVFYYPDDAYTGVYDIDFKNMIETIEISVETNFTTTLWGCQARGCHDAWSTQTNPSERVSTSVIHPNRLISGSLDSDCQTLCHGHYASQFLTATPVHLHEIQFGHTGGFICAESGWVTIFDDSDGGSGGSVLEIYADSTTTRPRSQTPLTVPSHVTVAECTDCHTSFVHDETGSARYNIAEPGYLNGTRIFSTGGHASVDCKLCHGSLDYPSLDQNQDQRSLNGTLGDYAPVFTTYQRLEDTYVIDVNDDSEIDLSVNGDDPSYDFTLQIVGPIDGTILQDLNTSDNWHGTYYVPDVNGTASFERGAKIYRPRNATRAKYSVFNDKLENGMWIVRIFGWSPGTLNYTITSSHPIAHKPVIHIPSNCSECHNPNPPTGCEDAKIAIPIPDWDEQGIAYAHADLNGGGSYDVPCRSCHNSLHEVSVMSCTECHRSLSGGHRGIPPQLTNDCIMCHFEPHYDPRNITSKITAGLGIVESTQQSYEISAGEIWGYAIAIPEYTRYVAFNSTWNRGGLEMIVVRPDAVSELGVGISEYATMQGYGSDWKLNLTGAMSDLPFDFEMVLRDDQNTDQKYIYVKNPEPGIWYVYTIGLGAGDTTSDAALSIDYDYSFFARCTLCHAPADAPEAPLGAPPLPPTAEPNFIHDDFKKGIHALVNGASGDINRACWACHGDGDIPSGHPGSGVKKMNCSNNDCHTYSRSKYGEPMVYEHFKDADRLDNRGNVTTSNVSTTVGCDSCHSNSVVETADPFMSKTYRVSHYGTTDELMAYTEHVWTDCVYCHEDEENSEDWGDAIDPMDEESAMIVEDEEKTMHTGDRWQLRNDYMMEVVSIDLNGNNAVIRLSRNGKTIDQQVVSRDTPFEYEKQITEDGRTYDQTIVSMNLTGVMRGTDDELATFEGRTIRRIHKETTNAACYACHVKGYLRNNRYTILKREGDMTYYTKVITDFDYEDNSSVVLRSGEDWNLGDGFVLKVKAVDTEGDLATLELVRADAVVEEEYVVHTGDTFEYEADIHPMNDLIVFSANVSGIFRSRADDLITLGDVRLISPDLIDADVEDSEDEADLRVDGYNVSWIDVGEDFGGGEPETFHVPPLTNGWDIVFADCVWCHDVSSGMDIKRVDAIESRLGAHAHLNEYADSDSELSDPINRACWACHGLGTEPSIHADAEPKDCVDCHVQQVLFGAPDLSDVPHGQINNCTSCHGGSVGGVHVIGKLDAIPRIGDLRISPDTCYPGDIVRLDATAVSGWNLKVVRAEYFIDFMGADGKGRPLEPVDGVFDCNTEKVSAEIDTTDLATGNHTIYVHAMESENTWGRVAFIKLTVEPRGVASVLTTLEKSLPSISMNWYALIIVAFLMVYAVTKFVEERKQRKRVK